MFPRKLGAVVMRTVLAGAPALQVTHFPDGEGWGITDGGDPNAPGACIATHISHVVDIDPSLVELAAMAPGHVANREQAAGPWIISRFEWAN